MGFLDGFIGNLRDTFALDSFEQSEMDKKLAEKVQRRYRSGVNFKQAQQLYDKFAEFQRFWEGEHWPEPTPQTKNLPRPVTNHFASIIDQKVAGLTYEMPEMYFEPVETDILSGNPTLKFPMVPAHPEELTEEQQEVPHDIDAADLLTHIAKHTADRLDFEELIDNGCRSAATLGTGIWYFPWDNTVTGGGPNSRFIGDIAGYEVDAVDFFPGDPTNPDIQTQPWIILAERRPLEEVKEYYKDDAPGIIDRIKDEAMSSDSMVYDHQKVEQDETKYVDILHCWWKEKAGQEPEEELEEGVGGPEEPLPDPTDMPLPPEGEQLPPPPPPEGMMGQVAELGQQPPPEQMMDPGMMMGPDMMESEIEPMPREVLKYVAVCQSYVLKREERLYEHGLYPFVAMQWQPRRKSFWGKPESNDIINNQKEENRLAGISLLCAYGTGLPNVMYKDGAIDPREIPIGPGGGKIKDTGPPGTWNATYMNPPTPAAHIPQLRESITAGMKDTSGVHEAWSGKAPSSQLNASAIIALQEAAGVRIRSIQRRLYRAIREMGALWLAYWKEFYTEQRLFRITGDDKIEGFAWFNGTELGDMEFDVTIEAGSSSPYSKTLLMATLDKLMEMGAIMPDEYLEVMPADVFPKAKQLLERRAERMQQEQMMMEQQRQQAIQQAVTELLRQSEERGFPITPEAVQHLLMVAEGVLNPEMMEAQAQEGGGAPPQQPQPM